MQHVVCHGRDMCLGWHVIPRNVLGEVSLTTSPALEWAPGRHWAHRCAQDGGRCEAGALWPPGQVIPLTCLLYSCTSSLIWYRFNHDALRLCSFEWCTCDLSDLKVTKEVYDLLSNNYVEDDDAMFRSVGIG